MELGYSLYAVQSGNRQSTGLGVSRGSVVGGEND